MGGSGSSSGGFMGFINSIPIWLYIVIAVVGLLIGILCFVLSGQARRRPGGGGGGAVAMGVISLLVLTVAPLVLMTIGLTSGPSRPKTVDISSSSTGGTTSSTGGFTSSGSTGGTTSTSGGFTSTGGTTTSSTSSSSSGGGDLAALLSASVEQARAQLPIRSGPATITDMQANGTTLVMTMEINSPANGRWAQLDPGLRSNICSGPFSTLIRSGASVQVDMSDSVGEEHTVTVSSC